MADSFHGVLVVDKPRGPTSHDVVAWARKVFDTRSVGHAGTLDPMATGVLVLAVGEGTKLVPYLTADDKEYVATVALGAATDTLDAQGTVTEQKSVPTGIDVASVAAAAARFLGVIEQEAPAVSAIKVDGKPLHERVRRGEDVKPPVREVVLHEVEVRSVHDDRIELRVACGKGFYVRSLARDLAQVLGTVGHLATLHRTRSGPFLVPGSLDGELLRSARGGDEDARDKALEALRDLPAAWGGRPKATLTDAGVEHARHGRPIPAETVSGGLPALAQDEVAALLDPAGGMVALARREEDTLRVVRGLRPC